MNQSIHTTILQLLKKVIDPDLKQNIVDLGFVKDLTITSDGIVRFVLELTTPTCPMRERFVEACRQQILSLPEIKDVVITVRARPIPKKAKELRGLVGVRRIIGVSSCKGGVGKSTVAVNLTFSLQRLGAKVGLFDADIYGPSLPTMVEVPQSSVYRKENGLLEPVFGPNQIKLMSFGYVQSGDQDAPVIMRGPMVSQVVQQLLHGTDWQDLDYLIIDLPPGTGDIVLTICQIVPLEGAVIVTTPQKISLVDVVKGIHMFDRLHVPVVSVIENMSYFVCDQCHKRHEIFGRGAKDVLTQQFGIRNTFQVPLVPEMTWCCDHGKPFVDSYPDHFLTRLYREIAQTVTQEIERQQYLKNYPVVTWQDQEGITISYEGQEVVWDPYELRMACKCAYCVNELTGERQIDPKTVPEKIIPVKIEKVGNYAIEIWWNDDHKSIFPYDFLLRKTKE